MKFKATNIGVDAGMVIIACMNYRKDVKKFGFCNKELKRLGKVFNVSNGKYKVKWHTDYEDYEDDVYEKLEGYGELSVTSGKVFVIDPCYVIGNDKNGKYIKDKWGDWLNLTDYGRNIDTNKAFILDAIHDDGCYDIVFELEKI